MSVTSVPRLSGEPGFPRVGRPAGDAVPQMTVEMRHGHDRWPVYEGSLGASLQGDSGTRFAVWAPTARQVCVTLYRSGDPDTPFFAEYALHEIEDGAWECFVEQALDGVYYDYLVVQTDGTAKRTSDPWGRASGVNGARSMVVDLRTTDPAGWAEDASPRLSQSQAVVWETHVGDFSNDPKGGFPKAHRGKYLAFTDENTWLRGVDGSSRFPTGVAYLRRLGVTYVELMPIYDYGSVDESRPQDDSYNWGYDPVAYNVPEGSYSSDPHDGKVRIRECKAMIAALHRAGLRVVMDVVYNHMFTADNSFERMAPGYFCRRDGEGSLCNGSGCGNDMATERPMYRRFIVESVRYWASEYHIDGFRFDLMGLVDVDTMNAVRAGLDALPRGEEILIYGEPWASGDTVLFDETGTGTEGGRSLSAMLADKSGRDALDRAIGWFSDESRDAIKGSVMREKSPGYVNGDALNRAGEVVNALDGWRGTPAAGKSVGQVVQYVSSHDDLTLWDKLCLTMRRSPALADYGAVRNVDDIRAANAVAAGLVMCSAGIPFLLSGEEFSRTKHGCANSFNQGSLLNELNWSQTAQEAPLVAWYSRLIEIRKEHRALFDGARHTLEAPEGVVAVSIVADDVFNGRGGEAVDSAGVDDHASSFVIVANPGDNAVSVSLPSMGVCGTKAGCSRSWSVLADSSRYCPKRIDSQQNVVAIADGCVRVPPSGFVLLGV